MTPAGSCACGCWRRGAGADVRSTALRGWRGALLVAAVTLAATLPGVLSIPVIDRDEARFAQASRHMLESGAPTSCRSCPTGCGWTSRR